MPRYCVSGEITISVSVEVEANTARGAILKARNMPMGSLCHQCETGEPGEWVPGGGLDGGEPENLRAEEL